MAKHNADKPARIVVVDRTPTDVERRLGVLERRVFDLDLENVRLRRALEAEGVPTTAAAQVGLDTMYEPFALPDPVADGAPPRNPRITRLRERLRAASAEEIAARAEKADEERLAILNSTAEKP